MAFIPDAFRHEHRVIVFHQLAGQLVWPDSLNPGSGKQLAGRSLPAFGILQEVRQFPKVLRHSPDRLLVGVFFLQKLPDTVLRLQVQSAAVHIPPGHQQPCSGTHALALGQPQGTFRSTLPNRSQWSRCRSGSTAVREQRPPSSGTAGSVCGQLLQGHFSFRLSARLPAKGAKRAIQRFFFFSGDVFPRSISPLTGRNSGAFRKYTNINMLRRFANVNRFHKIVNLFVYNCGTERYNKTRET